MTELLSEELREIVEEKVVWESLERLLMSDICPDCIKLKHQGFFRASLFLSG